MQIGGRARKQTCVYDTVGRKLTSQQGIYPDCQHFLGLQFAFDCVPSRQDGTAIHTRRKIPDSGLKVISRLHALSKCTGEISRARQKSSELHKIPFSVVSDVITFLSDFCPNLTSQSRHDSVEAPEIKLYIEHLAEGFAMNRAFAVVHLFTQL